MTKKIKYLIWGILTLSLLMPSYAKASVSAQTDNDYEATISELRAQIDEKDKQIEKYLKKLISIASNFLFIPYEKYSVENVAIPAFEAAKGTDYYTKYQIRLTLLKNYKSDIDSVIKFLAAHQNEAKNHSYDLSEWASSLREEFNYMAVVKSYRQFGEGWDETYLGKAIYSILAVLDNPDGTQGAQRIDAKFSNLWRSLMSTR